MESERERAARMVNEAASTLAEFCDSVRIFVTLPGESDAQNTNSFSVGRGNFYAQFGQIQHWMEQQLERTRIDEREDLEESEL